MKKILLALGFCLILSACANRPEEPEGFYYMPVKTDFFTLTSFEKNIKMGEPLRIYIEGNGNPNPKQAIALALAEKDPYQNVIYLARPCQFSDDDVCDHSIIWEDGQFNAEIVSEMKNATIQLMRRYRAPSVEFVGYDGGATLALLLATRIPQTTRVITIDGIMDTNAYVQNNRGTSFKKSLNPADEKNQLSVKPQIHYVGKKDKITPPKTAERFVARQPNPVNATVKTVNNVDHYDWLDVQFDYYQMPNSSKQ